MGRYARSDGPDLELTREIRLKARDRRRKGLDGLLTDPEGVLARPHETFALLVGCRRGAGGGVTRTEFCEVSGRPGWGRGIWAGAHGHNDGEVCVVWERDRP